MNPVRARVVAALDKVTEQRRGLFAALQVVEMVDELTALGFEPANPLDLSDRPITGLTYLSRAHSGQHQYVSLATYEGRFVEAIIEVYTQPKDPKGRKRLVPLHCSIARDLETILARVNTVYPLPTP